MTKLDILNLATFIATEGTELMEKHCIPGDQTGKFEASMAASRVLTGIAAALVNFAKTMEDK